MRGLKILVLIFLSIFVLTVSTRFLVVEENLEDVGEVDYKHEELDAANDKIDGTGAMAQQDYENLQAVEADLP